VRHYFFGRLDQACTAFTPTMPAQEMATPRMPGSVLVAEIAVIGTPTPSEMMPRTNWRVRPDFSSWVVEFATSA
jgi:hypothetical protein